MTDKVYVSTWLNRRWRGAWILGERHTVDQSWTVGRVGVWLALPEDRSRNSWRWLCLRLRRAGPYWSIRWTLPKSAATGGERG